MIDPHSGNLVCNNKAFRIRIPVRWIREEKGLGSLIGFLTSRLGISTCGGCQRRSDYLDRKIRLIGTAGPPAPKPGCWFVGTNCYGFIQTLKFCCSDGSEYTERYGWCIGGWRAPPCVGARAREDTVRADHTATAGSYSPHQTNNVTVGRRSR